MWPIGKVHVYSSIYEVKSLRRRLGKPPLPSWSILIHLAHGQGLKTVRISPRKKTCCNLFSPWFVTHTVGLSNSHENMSKHFNTPPGVNNMSSRNQKPNQFPFPTQPQSASVAAAAAASNRSQTNNNFYNFANNSRLKYDFSLDKPVIMIAGKVCISVSPYWTLYLLMFSILFDRNMNKFVRVIFKRSANSAPDHLAKWNVCCTHHRIPS